MPRLLYIGCLGYQNIGDEACLDGFRTLVEPRLPNDWQLDAQNGYDFDPQTPFDALVLGGGTLLCPHGNLGDDALREAQKRGVPYYIFGTGLESLEWDTPAEEAQLTEFIRLVSGARRIGVRGPQSAEYLASIGVDASRIEVVGDPAVAVSARPLTVDLNVHGKRWLGVNVGTSFGRIYGWDEDRMVDVLLAALIEIAKTGWNICLFPVWPRDLEMQNSLSDRLEATGAVVNNVQQVLPAYELLSLLGQFETVIAMKLHAGIFAATAGVPYMPYAYRPKVEDFAKAVGVSEFIVRTDASASTVLGTYQSLTYRLDCIRDHLQQQVCAMRKRLDRFAVEVVADVLTSSKIRKS